MNKIKKLSVFVLVFLFIFFLVSCSCSCKKEDNPEDNKVYYNNEEDPLVFSSQEFDKVFNPFFSTSAMDSNVVGLTQIGMLSNDKEGKVIYGDEEAVVTKDLEIRNNGGVKDVDLQTTYYFVLKNNVKFSNGSALTIKDVLFNLYVYLDPAYTGSSTIYSTDIVGLKEYRTQSADEVEQDSFRRQFENLATDRIEALVTIDSYIKEDHKNEFIDVDTYITYLTEYVSTNAYRHVVDDFNKAIELFREELENDWSNSLDSYRTYKFSDQNGREYPNLFTTDVEAFLYNEGYITWNKKDAKLTTTLANNETELKSWTKEAAINAVYNDKVPNDISEIVLYWATSTNLFDYLTNIEMEEASKNTDRTYTNISGIKFANKDEAVTVNGVTYNTPTYNADGSVANGNEVLSITIKNIDPKAIWNFAFGVAPMYYYSDAEHIAEFDYVSNFGVEYMSTTFMETVVKSPEKIGLPVGAGPYAASRSSGGIDNVKANEFYNLGIVYYERNPYYVMGPATIKKIRYQVVPSNNVLNSLYSEAIDFAEPNAKPEIIAELNTHKADGIENKSIRTSGYGYIGINAGKVPDLKVRQAIMHCINTKECVDYYKTTAEAIYRSMSKSSWAYPTDAISYYPYLGTAVPADEDLSRVNPDYANYIYELENAGQLASNRILTKAQQEAFIESLIKAAGYELNDNQIYYKGSHVLEYKFTIAGEETDHPAWAALYHASEILNANGFKITVSTDANALKKLASGDLTVWAAAWGSTIDPDMYQVYHKDSTATSVLNWGYKQIKQNVGGRYDVELAIVEELSELIEQARSIDDETQRARLYSDALDKVMELAVELPTYQRNDLFAYSSKKIDVNSLTPDSETSPFKGLTSDIHLVSLNVER